MPGRSRPRIVILGRQGSGKGTQGKRLAAHLGIPHVSTGDLFRAAVREATPIGRRVGGILDGGGLVPDALVLDVLEEHAAGTDMAASGYLLDGFPRTVAQAVAFFGASPDLGRARPNHPGLDAALELDVPVEVVVDRISKRRMCPVDGWTTTVEDPAIGSVLCPAGHAAVQRGDDTPDAVRRRLALYDLNTGPLSPWFAARHCLVTVDGVGSTDEVFARLVRELDDRLDVSRDEATTPST
ncbi:MAG: nucleoside monophosphate kinase [Acidimicrobiales bacterium]